MKSLKKMVIILCIYNISAFAESRNNRDSFVDSPGVLSCTIFPKSFNHPGDLTMGSNEKGDFGNVYNNQLEFIKDANTGAKTFVTKFVLIIPIAAPKKDDNFRRGPAKGGFLSKGKGYWKKNHLNRTGKDKYIWNEDMKIYAYAADTDSQVPYWLNKNTHIIGFREDRKKDYLQRIKYTFPKKKSLEVFGQYLFETSSPNGSYPFSIESAKFLGDFNTFYNQDALIAEDVLFDPSDSGNPAQPLILKDLTKPSVDIRLRIKVKDLSSATKSKTYLARATNCYFKLNWK